MFSKQTSSTAIDQSQVSRFLAFRLCQDIEVMVEIAVVLATLDVSRDRIMPMPGMAAWVLGSYNWRGEILWVADLPQFLRPMDRQTDPTAISDSGWHSIVVIQTDGLALGIAVEKVYEVRSFSQNAVHPQSELSIRQILRPFISGSVIDETGSLYPLLDMKIICEQMWDQMLKLTLKR